MKPLHTITVPANLPYLQRPGQGAELAAGSQAWAPDLIYLKPGEHHVAAGQVVIRTLLGSCVSACLYDPVCRVVGMNHFFLGNHDQAKGFQITRSEAGRYGVHAMEIVINGMLSLGARKENLRAKAFGAGAVLPNPTGGDSFSSVADTNRRFILEFLQNEGIPLVASDLGGEQGRLIYFSSANYSVQLRRISRPVSRG